MEERVYTTNRVTTHADFNANRTVIRFYPAEDSMYRAVIQYPNGRIEEKFYQSGLVFKELLKVIPNTSKSHCYGPTGNLFVFDNEPNTELHQDGSTQVRIQLAGKDNDLTDRFSLGSKLRGYAACTRTMARNKHITNMVCVLGLMGSLLTTSAIAYYHNVELPRQDELKASYRFQILQNGYDEAHKSPLYHQVAEEMDAQLAKQEQGPTEEEMKALEAKVNKLYEDQQRRQRELQVIKDVNPNTGGGTLEDLYQTISQEEHYSK